MKILIALVFDLKNRYIFIEKHRFKAWGADGMMALARRRPGPVITIKQIEALHWIVKLGSFERAAAHLNTSQSAISKRVQELELSIGEAIFDRNLRGARLTERGEQVLALGREILVVYERIQNLKSGGEMPARRLRMGVTELSAITWLPRLVTALRRSFPAVIIEPEVDLSRNLHDRLIEESIDLIVIPEVWSDPDITTVRLAEVCNAWMARPGLFESSGSLTMHELAEFPLLMQGGRSGTGIFYNKWLRSEGIELRRTLASDSLMALVGLTVAGVGISYLPHQCFQPLVDEGKLAIVSTQPALPSVPYAVMYRGDRPSAFIPTVAELVREVCDFSQQLQW